MSHVDFVTAFAQMWEGKRSIQSLWHPHGRLIHPVLSRTIEGRLMPYFQQINQAVLPDLKWELQNWSARDELVFIEWECAATVSEQLIHWSGVDRFILRDGLIQEESVFSDSIALRSAMDPAGKWPALVNADDLEAMWRQDNPV